MPEDPNDTTDAKPAEQPAPETPEPAPALDTVITEAQGRIHIIGPGEVVIDGRSG